MTNPPQPKVHTLELATLEGVIRSALASLPATGGTSPSVALRIQEQVAEGLRELRHGMNRGDNGDTVEEVVLRRVADATGTPAHHPMVRARTSVIVTHLIQARAAGAEYDTLAHRVPVTSLEETPEDQTGYVLLQYVEAANRRTEAVRAHLMEELRQRDDLLRDLRAQVAQLQAEVDR